MNDIDTFLTILYVLVDDFFQEALPREQRPGPEPSLSRSEVVTLAVFAQWERFGSERGFYRFAQQHLKCAFPTLPDRAQLNRLFRRDAQATQAFFLFLVQSLHAQRCGYEVLDTSAVPTRDPKRRGNGWLPGLADISWSNRLGWYEGFHLLISVNPRGVITGFGFGQGSASDKALAETFFEFRHFLEPRLLTVGARAQAPYFADKGFHGAPNQQHWEEDYGAKVVCPPKNKARSPWPKALRRLLSHVREIVETVFGKLHHTFRLDRERPHDLGGFQARLAAKMALHNFCIWLNHQLGRPDLAFEDLLAW